MALNGSRSLALTEWQSMARNGIVRFMLTQMAKKRNAIKGAVRLSLSNL
jgi:hypothetical protein